MHNCCANSCLRKGAWFPNSFSSMLVLKPAPAQGNITMQTASNRKRLPAPFSSDDTAACAQVISSPCQGSLAEAVAAKGQETGINAVSPVARLQILLGGLWLSVEACTVRAYLRDGTFARCSQSYTHSVPVCVKRHRKKLHRHVQIRVEMQTLSPCG